ncbi:MAG: TolC family protein [Lachnospiraceae bacterium]|nr:TolC family protein [Lachnospiraceae bacterium]
MTIKTEKNAIRNFTALSFLTLSFLCLGLQARAEDPLFTMDTAISTAISNSEEYAKLESELAVKEVELKQAVKTIRLKQKNMSTFRWSPLINFELPEKPDLGEEFEFQFKPIQIEAEIDVLEHKLTDQKLATTQEVTTLYTDILVGIQEVEFYEGRLEELRERLEKTRADVKVGGSTVNDAETLEEKIQTFQNSLAAKQRDLMNNKKKLSEMCGMELTLGYRFEEDFIDVRLRRSQLPQLIQHTLDGDAGYYEVCMNATTEKIALETNYSLMENQYGDKMRHISSFVTQALEGEKVDQNAFKLKYDAFLTAIDEPWQGSVRLLFLKIPKEWFKGQISGIRYVEDASYSLYEAALSYQDALLEKENRAKELRQSVEEEYNNVIGLQSAYQNLREEVKKSEATLEKEGIYLRMGELTREEYMTSMDSYEELWQETMEAMGEYVKAIYSFDRLTCGGVSAILGDGMEGSYIRGVYANGAYYYMESIIQEQEFRLGVSIPSDFPIALTHYELWCDHLCIGGRTPIGQTIRHLKLAVEDVDTVKLRFYAGEEFVDDCVINPEETTGALSILEAYLVEETEDTLIGTYLLTTNPVTGMIGIELETKPIEGIAFYRILDQEGTGLGSGEYLAIDAPFEHLGLLSDSLEELKLEFYDEAKNLLYRGYFDTVNESLRKEEAADE